MNLLKQSITQKSKHAIKNTDLLIIDQNIDTGTFTGRLIFNMLAAIAEFENDLRTERQTEGIAKANGVKFGQPSKLTPERQQAISTT